MAKVFSSKLLGHGVFTANLHSCRAVHFVGFTVLTLSSVFNVFYSSVLTGWFPQCLFRIVGVALLVKKFRRHDAVFVLEVYRNI